MDPDNGGWEQPCDSHVYNSLPCARQDFCIAHYSHYLTGSQQRPLSGVLEAPVSAGGTPLSLGVSLCKFFVCRTFVCVHVCVCMNACLL